MSLVAWLGSLLLSAPVLGQGQASPEVGDGGSETLEGLVLTPTLSISGFYDDNVFVTARDPQESAGGRLTAGLAASVPAGRDVAFTGSYTIASDQFVEFQELDDVIASQDASLGISYRIGRRTSASLLGGYSMSRRPQDVLPEVGLAFNRGPTERFSGGIQVDRELWRGSRLGFSYTYAYFRYTTVRTLEERPSESWAGQWTQKIGRWTSISASGGVQNIEGDFTPTYSFSISRAQRTTSLSLAYSRGHYPVPTVDGSADSESISGGIGMQLGRRLSLTLSPRLSQNSDSFRLVRSASLGATASYALTRSVSLQASYQGWYQQVEESVSGAPRSDPELQHNVVYFGVSFGRPYRIR